MVYKITKKQNNSDMCMVCGMNNPYSFKAGFYETDKDILVAITKGLEEHQSYPNRMHGGVICALLDEVIGRAIQIKDPSQWGVTMEISVKYRKPVPLNEKLIIAGRITDENRRTFTGKGIVEDLNGNLLATATAIYFKQPVEKIINADHVDFLWEVFPDKKTIETIEIKNDDAF